MPDERKLHQASEAIPSEAEQLRRTAQRFKAMGMTTSATLFANAAWIAEHGCEWMEYMRRDGHADDVEVRQ